MATLAAYGVTWRPPAASGGLRRDVARPASRPSPPYGVGQNRGFSTPGNQRGFRQVPQDFSVNQRASETGGMAGLFGPCVPVHTSPSTQSAHNTPPTVRRAPRHAQDDVLNLRAVPLRCRSDASPAGGSVKTFAKAY